MSLLTGADLIYNVKKYFSPSREELEAFLIAVVAMTVIVGFNDQSLGSFRLGFWLTNFIICAIIIFLCATVFVSSQRIFALWWGYRTEFKIFYPGLAVGLMLTLMTFGLYPIFWWLGTHGIQVQMIEAQRLGYFRYFVRIWDVAIIALMGPISLLLLALIFRIFYFLPSVETLQLAVKICVLYAGYQMLPIPPLAGHNIFFASRWLYFLVFGLILGFGFLIQNPHIPLIISLFLTFIAGIVMVFFYVKVIDAKLM